MRNFLFGIFIGIDGLLMAGILYGLFHIKHLTILEKTFNSFHGALWLDINCMISGVAVSIFITNRSRVKGCLCSVFICLLLMFFIGHFAFGINDTPWKMVLIEIMYVLLQLLLAFSSFAVPLLICICLRMIVSCKFLKDNSGYAN